MLSFTEEFLLLLLGVEGGTIAPVPRSTLACAFAGAVLMDLAFANRIDTDLATLFVVDRTPTGNPTLDRVLAKIEALEEAADARSWIGALSEKDALIVRDQATMSLIQRGILRVPVNTFNWVFSAQGAAVDSSVRRDVRARLRDALSTDDIPTPRDAALIGLMDACGMLGGIFRDLDMEACRPRIDTLRGMELVIRTSRARSRTSRTACDTSLANGTKATAECHRTFALQTSSWELHPPPQVQAACCRREPELVERLKKCPAGSPVVRAGSFDHAANELSVLQFRIDSWRTRRDRINEL